MTAAQTPTQTPTHPGAQPAAPSSAMPRPRVALETTLLVHGVSGGPGSEVGATARDLVQRLDRVIRAGGAVPAVVGVYAGKPIVGLTGEQIAAMLAEPGKTRKVNTANLGAVMASGGHGATTVSATMELASRAGVSVFATGGIGGVHPLGTPPTHGPFGVLNPRLDISSDVIAFTRFPVAVVTSGVKSILDVAATREILETLGVPVVGYRTSDFPAFYLRRSPDQRVAALDARFDDIESLARFLRSELARTGRGVVVCNAIPEAAELVRADWLRWLDEAHRQISVQVESAGGRDVTPTLLAALHEVSGGATLRANIALVEDNARVAALLAAAMATT